MSGLLRLLSTGRSIVLETLDSFLHGWPPSALPCLAAAQYGQLQLPSENSGVLAPWNDWLTLAVPKKRTSAHRCRWNRRKKIVQPVDRFVECKTCGGTKDKDMLCPNCLRNILVKTAEMIKDGEDQREAKPYDKYALARFTYQKLQPKYTSMLKWPVWHDYKNQHINYDYLLWELNKSPFLNEEAKKEAEEGNAPEKKA